MILKIQAFEKVLNDEDIGIDGEEEEEEEKKEII